MWILKYLNGGLSELAHLCFKGGPLDPAHWFVEVDMLLVGEVVVEVVESNRRGSTLLVAEDQINPLVDVG